ncbi:hypothetical protein [Propionibacterium acidifaciens]
MQVGVTLEETAVLVRWKKRSDNHVLVRMKTEAILHASPWRRRGHHREDG